MAVAPDFTEQRRRMVERQLRDEGIGDERVLTAMGAVPREAFVPERQRDLAYADRPLPIGAGQTISQPYIVAAMMAALRLQGDERVLEVGTGSGYAAAVLACLAREVISVEREPALAERARQSLGALGVTNVQVEIGDGSLGWPPAAPFDGIVVAAGGPQVPPSLLAQLAPGGRLVMPVGDDAVQHLVRVTRAADGSLDEERLASVRFVPLIGAEGWPG